MTEPMMATYEIINAKTGKVLRTFLFMDDALRCARDEFIGSGLNLTIREVDGISLETTDEKVEEFSHAKYRNIDDDWNASYGH